MFFWHAPLGVGLRSAKRRHQSPDWMILSHVSCFIPVEFIGFQDSLHPRSTYTRTTKHLNGNGYDVWTVSPVLKEKEFFMTAPVVWNSLPLHLRSPSISRSQFLSGLKTHLFTLAFH